MCQSTRLLDQYKEALQEFPTYRYSSIIPISRDDIHPAFGYAINIAHELFPSENKAIAKDGSIIIELENKKILAFVCVSNHRLKAFALRSKNIKNLYFIGLSTGFIKTTFEISAAIWNNSDFLKIIGKVNKNLSSRIKFSGIDIPRGLESIYFEYIENTIHKSYSNLQDNYINQPLWLNSIVDNLSGDRMDLMIETFKQSLKLSWLHESAHILRGHIDFQAKQKQTNLSFSEFFQYADYDILYFDAEIQNSTNISWVLEFDADEFALNYLFKEAYDTNEYVLPISTFLGSVLCFIIVDCYHKVYNLTEKTDYRKSTHPPLWIRASRVRQIESIWATIHQKRTFLSLEKRNVNSELLTQCLLDIMNIHPLFGQSIYPLLDNSLSQVQEKIMIEVRQDLQKVQTALLEAWENSC